MMYSSFYWHMKVACELRKSQDIKIYLTRYDGLLCIYSYNRSHDILDNTLHGVNLVELLYREPCF